jgi:hypothetical protein
MNTQSKNVRSAKFPFGLILRWLLSGALIIIGVLHLIRLGSSWSYWSEMVIIDSAYSPYPWLIVELCVLVTGLLLLIRSKWVFISITLHIAIFARQLLVSLKSPSEISPEMMEIWFAELVTLAFCYWLLTKGRLK